MPPAITFRILHHYLEGNRRHWLINLAEHQNHVRSLKKSSKPSSYPRSIKSESLGLGPGPGGFLENDLVDTELQSGLRMLDLLLLKRGVLLPL